MFTLRKTAYEYRFTELTNSPIPITADSDHEKALSIKYQGWPC